MAAEKAFYRHDAILRARHATSSNEDFSIFSALSVLQSDQNSREFKRIQDGDEENSAARRKLRAN